MKIEKMLKKIVLFIILILVLIPNYIFADNSTELNIYADSAILIDNKSGKILYSKNANKKMYPASTTKILTAIMSIEHFNLDDKLTASYEAVMSIPSGYSNAAIQVGESLTIQELLEVFLVHSANEAGYILAEGISGSISKFADLMNKKALEIGCQNTHFTNPSGLHDENHYTTAYDLSQIAQYCMKNETFRKIVSMTSCTIAPTDKYEERYFRNTNEMLNSRSQYYNKNIIGIKTGYTSQAQNCLISGFKKENMELISVVLGSPGYVENRISGKYTDTQNLFDYGIENFSYKNIATAGRVITQIKVEHATSDTEYLDLILQNNINILVNNSLNIDALKPSIKINENISAPITQNDVVGTVTYNIDGEIYSSNLLAKTNVEADKFLENLLKIFFAILILIFIYKLMYSRKNNKRKKKKSNGKYLYGRVKY